jgi:protein-S-isoprenylcysteine O-methyltransferase Ste14
MSIPEKILLTRSRLRDMVIVLCIVSGFFFHVSTGAIIFSLCLLCIGTFVHVVSKGVLIRNEVLCRDGIYGLARHPYYLANYLVDTSFCLLSGNIYLVLIYPFLFFWSYGPTIRQEERNLEARHGNAEVENMFNTPAVIPDRQSIKNFARLFQGFSVARISSKEIARVVRFFAVALLIFGIHAIEWEDFENLTKGTYFPTYFLPTLVTAGLLYIVSLLILRSGSRD